MGHIIGMPGSRVVAGGSGLPVTAGLVLQAEADFGTYSDGGYAGGGSTPSTDGGVVTEWADQSGLSHRLAQETAGEKPLYDADAFGVGKPGIQFDGTDDRLFIATGWLTALTSGEVFVVAKHSTNNPTTGGFWILGPVVSGNAHTVPWTDGIIYDGAGATARKTVGNPTPSVALPFCYNVSTASGAWTARFNSTELHTTGTNTVGWDSNPQIGRSSSVGSSYFMTGWFAALLIYDAVLSAGDRTLVYDYLAAKWGVV